MIQTVIFDWDGTLHDTKALYGKAFRKAYAWLVETGAAPEKYYSDEDTKVYLGMSAPAMWEAFMPELEETIKKKASEMIGQEMDRLIVAGEAKMYDKAEDILLYLKEKGYHLVILSNCRHAYLEEHKKFFCLDRYFEAYYAAEDFAFAAKENIFPKIADVFPGEYVVIGDRASDIETARVHHLTSVSCRYGFGTEDELKEATWHINDIEELKKYL